MLEASRMDRTDLTQGDLEELCESSLGGNMRQEDVPAREDSSLTNRPTTDSSPNSGIFGLASSNPGLLDIGFATRPSSELLTPGEGSTHTPASVESASQTLTGFDVSACVSASWFSFHTRVQFGYFLETTGLEAWLERVKEAEEVSLD